MANYRISCFYRPELRNSRYYINRDEQAGREGGAVLIVACYYIYITFLLSSVLFIPPISQEIDPAVRDAERRARRRK